MKRIVLSGTISLAAMLSPTGAIAQGEARATSAQEPPQPTSIAASEQENYIGDIIVTAQKQSESINRVPITIVAATGDQLRSRGIIQPADLTKIVSGFQATQSQTGTPVYYLRGVGFDDVSVAARPTVTLYNDEAALPYAVMAIGTSLDLERVEVLKGPQGLLFGSNSTGGAINFIAAKPTKTLEAGLNTSFGRFSESTIGGFVSGPVNDWLRVRVAAEHQGMDDWQRDYVDGKEIGKRDIWSGRLTLEANPNERFTARLTLFGATDRSDPQLPQYVGFDDAVAMPSLRAYPVAPRDNRATSFRDGGNRGVSLSKDNYTWQTTFRADYRINDDATVTSLTSYARNGVEFAMDTDATQLFITQFGARGSIESFTQELRVAGTLQDLKYTVGGNYENSLARERVSTNIADAQVGNVFSGPPFNLPPIQEVPWKARSRFISEAAFGNLEYAIDDRLTVRAGARYTHARTKFSGCVIQEDMTGVIGVFAVFGVPSSFIAPGACQTVDVDSLLIGAPRPVLFADTLGENNLSWRLGVDYRLRPGTMLYASVNRGYKAGAYSNIAASLDTQYVPAEQEELTAYEVGFKSDVVPRVLHINAALFYYDYLNKQLQGTTVDPIFGPLQALVSIPKSRVWGTELEVVLRPADGLSLGGMMTYVNTRVTETFTNPSRFGVNGDLKGTRFPNTPKWQASGNIEYRTALSADVEGFVGSNITYRSATFSDFFPDPRLKVDAYTLVDAQIGVEAADGRWKAAIYGRNIFDTYYWTNQIRPNEALARFTGMPATYGLQLTYRFK